MVKICITKTSNLDFEEIKEYENLEACVNNLLKQGLFKNTTPELVISKPQDYMSKESADCDYVVEIYDTWRE